MNLQMPSVRSRRARRSIPRTLIALIALALLAAACGSSEDSSSSETASPTVEEQPSDEAPAEEEVAAEEEPPSDAAAADDSGDPPAEPTPEPTPEPRYASGDSDVIFTQDQINTFELTLAPEDLAFLDADPAAEEEVLGSLTFDGETIDGVGIRYKGSVGSFINCLDGPDPFDPSGKKTCTKLSLNVDVEESEDDLEFYDQRSLQFHSLNRDPSMMHDRLGYWLLGQMDVPSPRATHVRLIINGEFSGIYALVEEVDGRFTRANYEDGEGNLYKSLWPTGEDGQARPPDHYLGELKTNEDENPSVALIESFAAEMGAAPPEQRGAVLQRWTDIEPLIAYAVVDRTIRHDDGPFHWYCGGFGGCNPHNFYWYEDPTAQKLHLIPWDLDDAFFNIVSDVRGTIAIGDGWGEITNNCQPYEYVEGKGLQRSAACDPIVAGMVSFDAEYQRLMSEFMAGPFSAAETNARLDEWAAQITPVVEEAAATHADAVPVAEWQAALADLRTSLDVARGS